MEKSKIHLFVHLCEWQSLDAGYPQILLVLMKNWWIMWLILDSIHEMAAHVGEKKTTTMVDDASFFQTMTQDDDE